MSKTKQLVASLSGNELPPPGEHVKLARYQWLYAHHPSAFLPKASNTLTILQHPPTIHMPFTIFSLAAPSPNISTLLKDIASLITTASLVNMFTAQICREPCADELDCLGSHVTEVSQLETVVVGIYGIVVRGADGVCSAKIGF